MKTVAERVIKPRIVEAKQETKQETKQGHWEPQHDFELRVWDKIPRTQIPYWKDEFPEELKNYTQIDIPYEVWSKYGKDWADFQKKYYLKVK